MKKILNKRVNKGITLIALVITIVVLVILAAVIISISLGNDGLISRAIKAAKGYKDAQEKDKAGINDLYGQISVAADGTIEGLTVTQLEELIDNRTSSLATQVSSLNTQLQALQSQNEIKTGTITKSSEILDLTVYRFNYNAHYGKINLGIKLKEDLTSGTTVTVGTMNETAARPRDTMREIGVYGPRGMVLFLKPDGVISIRNIGTTTLEKSNTDSAAIGIGMFYPIDV